MANLKKKGQSEEEVNPVEVSGSTGFASRVRKVLGQHRSPNKKRRKTLATGGIGSADDVSTFGRPLDKLVARRSSPNMKLKVSITETDSSDEGVPLIVSRIVNHVERHGLSCQGIYRINGNSKVMEKIKDEFDRSGAAKLDNCDIYSVGCILKQFLREIPEPIIPDGMIPDFIQVQKDKNGNLTKGGIVRLRELLSHLPPDNYNLLSFLCRHLLLVSTFSAKNKMTVVSLSIVFGPNIFRCGGGLKGLKLQGDTNSILAQMILFYKEVFEDWNGLLLVESDGSDEVFDPPPTSATVREDLREHMQDQKREKPFKIEPFSKQVDATDQPPVLSTTTLPSKASLFRRRAASESTASALVVHRPGLELRLRSHEEEGVQVQRTPSPSSWKSSPGTSPPTSPALTPRSSNVYSNLISDSVQHNLFPSPLLPLQPAATTATVTTTSAVTNSSRQTDSLTNANMTSRKSTKSVVNADQEQKQPVSSSLENMHEQANGVRLRGFRPRAKTHRGYSVYDGVLSSTQTLGRNFKKTTTDNGVNDDDEDQPSVPSSVDIDTPTNLTSRFDIPRARRPGYTRERSYSCGPEVGRIRVKSIVDAFERSRKFIMPNVGQSDSAASETESLPPPSVEMGSYSSLPEPIVAKEAPLLLTEQRRPAFALQHPQPLLLRTQRELQPEAEESGSLPKPRKAPTPAARREASSSTTSTEKHELDFSFSTSPPKDSPSESQTQLPAVTSEPTCLESKEQIVPQTEESLLQTNSKYELDYVTRTAGTLYHPTLKRVAGPSNRRKPQRRPSLLRSVSPPVLSVEQLDEPLASKAADMKQEITSSPRANRARGKVKQLIKSSHHPTSPPVSVNLVDVTDKEDNLVASKRTPEEEKDVIVAASGLTPSDSQSRENIAPEQTHEVQKGWEDMVPVSQQGANQEQRRSEGSKQAKRTSKRAKVKDHDKRIDGTSAVTASDAAEKGFPIKDSHSISVISDELPIKLSSEEPTATRKKKEPKVNSDRLKVPKPITAPISGPGRRLSSSSLNSLSDSNFQHPRKGAKIQRHQSLDLLQVGPAVVRKGSHESQDKTTLSPMAAVVEKIESRLREKRTEAGRPHDLREMSPDELEDEKHCIQKALLQFEKKFGRPQSHEDKAVMRPLYTRYRTLKQLLVQGDSKAHTTHEGFGSTTADTLASVTMMNLSMQKLPSTSSKTEAPTKKIYSRVARKISEDLRKREWMTPEEISRATSKSELAEELAVALERKKELKELLRKFESQIEGVHGRACTREDKRLMYSDYQEYKNLRSRINMLETALQKFPSQDIM